MTALPFDGKIAINRLESLSVEELNTLSKLSSNQINDLLRKIMTGEEPKADLPPVNPNETTGEI
jgi:hypothetical protein